MRLAMYAGASAALAAAVITSAFYQRANFYSAMTLVNLVFLVYGSFMYGLQRLCFGPLRPVEVEQLYEKAWFAVTETCLAMTVFREEVGAFFLVMFTALITGKVWGWIGEGRVEVLEQQPPANPRIFHTRMVVSLLASIVYNCWLLSYSTNTVIAQAKPTMMVMFLFEFAVLAVGSMHTGLRYVISLVEARVVHTQTKQRLEQRRREVREQRDEILRRREAGEIAEGEGEPLPNEDDIDEMDIEVPGWDAKGQWILFLDLFADLLKLSVYTAFFCVLLVFYGLPIHIMRDLFMTTRSFVKRLTALLRYKQALRDMNRYADATAEDLGREDTCIICREEMRPWDPNAGQIERTRPKKLPCGHILHFGCLKSWLERQQVCPTCRSSVVMDQHQPRNGQFRPRMAFHLAPNLPNGQNQPAAANGQAPGAQDAPPNGEAAQGGQQPAGARAAMRYINLGPIRLGFAQGGQEVAELANRMGVDLNGPNAPAATPQANIPTTTTADLSTMEAVRNRLLEVDQRIQQEVRDIQQGIQNVQTAQQELQCIHFMLAELARIRQLNHGQQQQTPAQNGQPGQPTPTPAAANTPAGGLPPLNVAGGVPFAMPPMMPFPPGQFPLPTHPPPSHPFSVRMNSPSVTRHGAASQTTAIPSGSPELPEGVVIPPGWSLLPLQRLDGAAAATGLPVPTGPGSHVHLPDLAQQVANAQASNTMHQSPVAPEDATSSTNGAAGHVEVHNSDAQQPAHVSTAEPTEVASPTPVTPNWGGSAQLFGGGASSGGLPFGMVPPGSSRSASQTREGGENDANGEASNAGASGEPDGSAAASSTAHEGHEHGSPSSSAKGKAPAATVEDAEDE
ncbi:ERAD-associated E3 ubiquitin-protein ligase HRD1 [Cytospora mali]|uniref:RING-type E3 ubiquitin transferase n=1 Tax=Cytospora mali TaxID=578113 RepID=A0A194W652_CYTMA|nr:ERAD-associated E3 ubiquitin-protein ligase HRD1 [Valsa mali]